MAYRFKLDEHIGKAFRRISRDQFGLALAELSAAEISPKRIHESRKSLKRLRALLRLVAPSIGAKPARQRNKALRDIGQLLSVSRDQAVSLETLAILEATSPPEDAAALAALRSQLSARASVLSGPLDPEIAARARQLLTREVEKFSKLRFKGKGFAALEPGLEGSYRNGRRAFAKAYTVHTDEAFHDLRKAVQWHWRQMSLISRAWPEAFEVRIAAARDLSQMLGDDHDLAILELASASGGALGKAERSTIRRICRGRQNELRAAAYFRAARLFAETPANFTSRMAAYWDAGRNIMLHTAPIQVAETAADQPLGDEQGKSTSDAANGAATSRPQSLASKTPGHAPSQRRA